MRSAEKRLKIVKGCFCVDGFVTNIDVVKYLSEDNINASNMTTTQQLQLFHGGLDDLLNLNSYIIQEDIILFMLYWLGLAALFTGTDNYDIVNSSIVMGNAICMIFNKTIPYSIRMERLYRFCLIHVCVMCIE